MQDTTPLLFEADAAKVDLPKTPLSRMYFLGVIVVAPSILAGMSISYSAVALPEMNLNVSQTSWFTSIAQFVAPLGALLTGAVIDTRGRRFTLIVSMLPSILGWLLLYWNSSIFVVYVGRLLTGINVGATYYPAQAYCDECVMVNSSSMRRDFMSWTGIAFSSGIFLNYLLGYHFNYLQISLIATVLSVLVALLLVVFVPESPFWLYLNRRIDEARSCERKLAIYQPYLHQDDDFVEPPPTWSLSSIKIVLKKLQRRDVHQPLLTFTLLYFILSVTGGPVLVSYTVDIIGGNSASSYLLGAVVGAIMWGANILTIFAMRFFSVKALATCSSVVMAVGMALIGYTTHEASRWFAAHLAAVCTASFAFSFCLSNQPRMLLGQVFPVDAKGFASVPAATISVAAGLMSEAHPYLQLTLGGYEFYIYCGICLVNAVCMYTLIPSSVDESLVRRGKLRS